MSNRHTNPDQTPAVTPQATLPATEEDPLIIGGRRFRSRLWIGTGKFGDHQIMREAILAAEADVVTIALRRLEHTDVARDPFLPYLQDIPDLLIVPNTSGAQTAEEAILLAELGAALVGHQWVKLEIHPNPRNLMPDPIETLKAAEQLVKKGFQVLPYVHADPVLCKRLEEIGCPAVMPLAAPIGTNRGLELRYLLEFIIQESRVPVIIDAGLGAPSHAAQAMEMGADAVLVNTAIATAGDPVQMARAFREAVLAGRRAWHAGLPASGPPSPTSPIEEIRAFLSTLEEEANQEAH